MAITFVYRSPYENPTGRYVKRLPDDSILAWFQRVWSSQAGHAEDDLSERLLGQHVYGFDSLFEAIKRYRLPVPRDQRELEQQLKTHLYAEGGIAFTPEVLQVLTNDDELELRYYFIDDSFIKENPSRCAFLVHEGGLPKDGLRSGSEPCTRLFVHAPEQTIYSQVWDRVVKPGVRLADLLGTIDSYEAMRNVNAVSVRQDLISLASSGASWRDSLAVISAKELGRGSRLANESVLDYSEHICQLHHHAATISWGRLQRRLFHQIIVFDDLWAAAHPELAAAIDFYASDAELI
ncbi:MAG: hypothetical protein ACKO81_09605 [Planctomycetota bacterium]